MQLEHYLWTICLLNNFIMLASSVKDSRSFKHGFIFAGLLHSNSLWHRLFVYGSGIPVMPQDFFFFWAFFCTSIAVITSLASWVRLDLISAVWGLFFFALPT